MLTIPIRSGNILHPGADIIVQQVNCRGVMGAGLAKQIATRYPGVLAMYKKYCQEHPEPSSMLGKVLFVETERTTPIIANIFDQNYYGRKGCFTDYAALEKGLASIVKFAEKDDMRVAIPYGLGCGLAGGNWNIVYGIIARQFEDYSRADIWAL